jgi:branched-chain amino acid transport system substrate-binding protein
MQHRAFLLLVIALSASGCAGGFAGIYGQSGGNATQPLGLGGAGQAASGQKVAILLPVTGPRADIGQVLAQAAELALPKEGAPGLDVIDTGGTAAGAAVAAKTAISNGDSMILGPLTSAETAAVAPIARSAGTVVLAFTNDSAQSQPGVWAIGITSDQQIRRLVAAAQGQGKTQFAALLPDSDFGRALESALTGATAAAGLSAPEVRMHGGGMGAITAATRELSDYANRRGPIDAKIKEARALGTSEGRHEAQDLTKSSIPPPNFNVLLLADTREELQEIAAMLPYYDVNRSSVQIIGPALWSSPSSGSGSVSGAWYAAPDSSTRQNLDQDYSAKYATRAPPLADLAFDAASIARVIVGPRGADVAALTQPAGFVGADGWIGFSPDGQVRRGLAVFRIERGGPALVEPAPQSSGVPGT